MENENKNKSILIFLVIMIAVLVTTLMNNHTEKKDTQMNKSKTFKIISSQENEESANIIKDFAKDNGYKIEIDYAGTIDIIDKLNNGEKYDAMWLSNSIWGYMLNDTVKVSNSKCTSINPVIFGIKKSKAK